MPYNGSAIGGQYATVVTIEKSTGKHRAVSFIFAANAVKSMVELASAAKALGWTQTLIGTNDSYSDGEFVSMSGEW